MSPLERLDWRDVPGWIQAVWGTAGAVPVLWGIQKLRATDFAARLRGETQLDDDGLADAIEHDQERFSLTVQGFEASMRAATTAKRWLLARVVAAAFAGDDARFDELSLLVRTASGLESYDIRLLVEISKPRPDSFPDLEIVGAIRQSELAQVLQEDQRDLVAPVVATLEREGIIRNEGASTLDAIPAWSLTPYGHRFLRFLPGRPSVEMGKATVVGVHGAPRLLLKNLGPGTATVTHISLTCDGESLLRKPDLPVTLMAGERAELPANNTVPPNGGARINLGWTDGTGTLCKSERIQWRRSG